MPAPVLLASSTFGPGRGPVRQGYTDPRRVWLETDGAAWRPSLEGIILPGLTGMGLPPVEPVTRTLPGVAGTQLVEVRVGEREIFLPIYLASEGSPQEFIDARTEFEEMLWPLGDQGASFRVVTQDHTGTREVPCTYVEGLTGDEGRTASGARWATLGVRVRAFDPWWQERKDRVLDFGLSEGSLVFLGAVGEPNSAPWPRRLSSSVVIGSDMGINITSSVPPWPTLELVGPMTSFEGTMSTGWHVHMDTPLAAGETLRLVTNPRHKSVRVNGAPAAGRLARGAVLKPFAPGVNRLDVVAPGGDENTRMRLSWRPLFRSAWGGR